MVDSEIYHLLEEKFRLYNQLDFIENDPIVIPHYFTEKKDIEISGFISATIAWGLRKTIINNGKKLMDYMGYSPYDFIMNASEQDLKGLHFFKHRTFNSEDLIFFCKSLKNIYTRYDSLEEIFLLNDLKDFEGGSHICQAGNFFFSIPHQKRTTKHFSNPEKGSAAKRINMFLRWMVRDDKQGVDFGIWKKIKPSELYIPLDVHSGRIARQLNLLKRTQNDWQSVVELTQVLRNFDPKDPIKYDFALFGLGVNEKFLE
jgi:uncharacterized protein (TIGR02757 family)